MDVVPAQREKPWHDGLWIRDRLLRDWTSLESLALELSVSVGTLRTYLAEAGVTLNGLAEQKARRYASRTLVFLPGAKPNFVEKTVQARPLETRHYTEDGYYPVIRKIFVKGVGLGYMSEPYPAGWAEMDLTLREKEHNVYDVIRTDVTILKVPKTALLYENENDLTRSIKRRMGPVKIEWD